jgi:adenosylmethionine-8-amino-7-oxononanoate aminotransferase
VPVLERGEGCYLWDQSGKRYLDGLSALFCCQIGYGRQELVDAAAEQMARLPFATNWGYAHQPAIDLAEALAERFPGTSTTCSSSTPGRRRSSRRSSSPSSTTA